MHLDIEIFQHTLFYLPVEHGHADLDTPCSVSGHIVSTGDVDLFAHACSEDIYSRMFKESADYRAYRYVLGDVLNACDETGYAPYDKLDLNARLGALYQLVDYDLVGEGIELCSDITVAACLGKRYLVVHIFKHLVLQALGSYHERSGVLHKLAHTQGFENLGCL